MYVHGKDSSDVTTDKRTSVDTAFGAQNKSNTITP
jgi:hypothetical protein